MPGKHFKLASQLHRCFDSGSMFNTTETSCASCHIIIKKPKKLNIAALIFFVARLRRKLKLVLRCTSEGKTDRRLACLTQQSSLSGNFSWFMFVITSSVCSIWFPNKDMLMYIPRCIIWNSEENSLIVCERIRICLSLYFWDFLLKLHCGIICNMTDYYLYTGTQNDDLSYAELLS